MAGVSGGGSSSFGSGRRRSLDAEINLVPFIDLLSMCICFLLMTAVWTQLGSVQVKQANGTEAAAVAPSKSVDLELKFLSKTEAMLQVKKAGKTSQQLKTNYSQLNSQLMSLKSTLSREGLKVSSVFLTPHVSVDYGSMVAYMDIFRKNEMINIGVIPHGSR